jgi:hypothetical protein
VRFGGYTHFQGLAVVAWEGIVNRRWFFLAALSVMSCAAERLAAVRRTVAVQANCPARQLNVLEVGGGWYDEGCDTRYFCQVAGEQCAEDPTMAQRLGRTQQVFSKNTGCPIADIFVEPNVQGFLASGCGRYAMCSSYRGPCMPVEAPTCEERAKHRYDYCVLEARHTNGSYWGSAAIVVAGTVMSTLQANRLLDECRRQFDAESQKCQ